MGSNEFSFNVLDFYYILTNYHCQVENGLASLNEILHVANQMNNIYHVTPEPSLA